MSDTVAAGAVGAGDFNLQGFLFGDFEVYFEPLLERLDEESSETTEAEGAVTAGHLHEPYFKVFIPRVVHFLAVLIVALQLAKLVGTELVSVRRKYDHFLLFFFMLRFVLG